MGGDFPPHASGAYDTFWKESITAEMGFAFHGAGTGIRQKRVFPKGLVSFQKHLNDMSGTAFRSFRKSF